MAVERSFSMLKPGIVQRRLVGEVLTRLERKGLRIVALKMMRISRELAERHYAEHRGKDFYEPLIRYITSGPVMAMVLEADGAVAALRRLCGATRTDEALAGTIRGDFANHTNLNVIHASDSALSAEREIALFFSDAEINEWKDGEDEWI
jgi:nucleoside-diphosphate kinase